MQFDVLLQKKLISLVRREVEKSAKTGDDPFAALLVETATGRVVLKAHCTQLRDSDRLAHAEINLIRRACKTFKNQFLHGYSVVTNAEPCSMCAAALIKVEIDALYFGVPHGARPIKNGRGMDPYMTVEQVMAASRHKVLVVGGIEAELCADQVERIKNI